MGSSSKVQLPEWSRYPQLLSTFISELSRSMHFKCEFKRFVSLSRNHECKKDFFRKSQRLFLVTFFLFFTTVCLNSFDRRDRLHSYKKEKKKRKTRKNLFVSSILLFFLFAIVQRVFKSRI